MAIAVHGINDARNAWMGSRHLGWPAAAHMNLCDRDLQAWAASGRTFRCVIDLGPIDSTGDGVPDSEAAWALVDAVYRRCGDYGVKIMPMIWATSGGVPRPMDTFARRQAFAKMAAAFYARYKAKPAWEGRIELWNEQNQVYSAGVGFWNNTAGNHAEHYGRLLGQVWEQINLVTPRWNKLITGGLAEFSTNGASPGDWLGTALAYAGAEVTLPHYAPGSGTTANPYWLIEGIGMHAYGHGAAYWPPQQAYANVMAQRSRLETIWFPNWTVPPTWITEFGWRRSGGATNGDANVYSDADIRQRYEELYVPCWTSGVVAAMFAYNYRNGNSGNTMHDGFGMNGTAGTTVATDTTQTHTAEYSFGDWWM